MATDDAKAVAIASAPAPVAFLKIPNFDGMDARTALDAFLKSEEFYVERGLRVVCETFEQRLIVHNKLQIETVLDPQDIGEIFLNISPIYDFNRKLYGELMKARLVGIDELMTRLGKIMSQHIPFFKLYTTYIKAQKKAQAAFETARLKKKFQQFLQINEECCGHQLAEMLTVPVMRLPQYLRFLGAIHSKMHDSDKAAMELGDALTQLLAMTDEIAETLRDEKARRMVVTLQQQWFKNNCELVSQARFFIKQGDMKIIFPKSLFKARWKRYVFILFNDMLLWSTKKGMFAASIVDMHRLHGMTVTDEPNGPDYGSAFKIRISGIQDSPNVELLLSCKSDAEKQKWMQVLEACIAANDDALESLASEQIISDEDFECFIKKKKKEPVKMITKPKRVSPPNSSKGPAHRLDYKSPSAPSFNAPPAAPGGATQSGDWVELWDDSNACYYYENLATGVTSWDKPPGFVGGKNKSAPAPAAADSKNGWIECQTDDGETYYENLNTGVTAWDPPPEFQKKPSSMGPPPAFPPSSPSPAPPAFPPSMPSAPSAPKPYATLTKQPTMTSPPPHIAPRPTPPAIPTTASRSPPPIPPGGGGPPPFNPGPPSPAPPSFGPPSPGPPSPFSAPPAPGPPPMAPPAPDAPPMAPPMAPSAPPPSARPPPGGPPKPSAPPPAAAGRGSLLDQIQAGKTLNKVSAMPSSAPEPAAPTNAIQAALANSLAKFRDAVADEEENMDYDGDDWD